MNGERARLEALTGLHLAQIGVFEQSVLIEFVFHIGERKLRAPDRNLEFGEDPGQGTDVVLVAVGEDDAAHPLAVLDEVGNVGNNDVDSQPFSFREHEAGLADDNVIAPADRHAVHTELAEAPQGDNLQFSSWHEVTLDASTDCVAYRTESRFYCLRPIVFAGGLS